MASTQQPGPQPAASSRPAATPEQLQSAFDNSVWYLLALWHPLHIAVSSSWGGPSSSDKRDWFAGAISDLLTTRPDTDAEDLECFLLQIMQDEFDCNVEDESEVTVARDILGVRKRMMEERTVEAAREVEDRWRNRGNMKTDISVRVVEEEGEWEGIEEDDDEDEDDEVDDAPQLVPAAAPKGKVAREIDDDGFQKVVSKKKR